jgi:hypothetical protein
VGKYCSCVMVEIRKCQSLRVTLFGTSPRPDGLNIIAGFGSRITFLGSKNSCETITPFISLLLVHVSRGPLCTYPSTLCVYHAPIRGGCANISGGVRLSRAYIYLAHCTKKRRINDLTSSFWFHCQLILYDWPDTSCEGGLQIEITWAAAASEATADCSNTSRKPIPARDGNMGYMFDILIAKHVEL